MGKFYIKVLLEFRVVHKEIIMWLKTYRLGGDEVVSGIELGIDKILNPSLITKDPHLFVVWQLNLIHPIFKIGSFGFAD